MFQGGEKIKKFFQNLITKIKKQPRWLLMLFLTVAVFLIIAIVCLFLIPTEKLTEEIEYNKGKEILDGKIIDLVERKIDGSLVELGSEDLYPIAIMIENHWDARPASGLSRANLVYEAITEGGITRFLAVYANYNEEIKKIGPVRSARPYYVDWVSELDALYMHCGGSNEALANIKNYGIEDLNEFYYGGYYWRSSRPRPHNIYTSSELISKALKLKSLNKQKGDYESWKFKEDNKKEDRPESANIVIDYGKPEFFVQWVYDKENNEYIRQMAGEEHQDEDSSQIRAKNIIVQYTKMWVIDDYGRKKIETVGEGNAIVFSDGQAIEGIWQKEKRTSRTKFYNEFDEEIEFNRGITWIQVVPNGYEVSWE